MADGSTQFQEVRQIEEVFGEHGFGFDRDSGGQTVTTFLFKDDGRRQQLGWVRGHVADGALIDGPFFGSQRRVHLIGGAA